MTKSEFFKLIESANNAWPEVFKLFMDYDFNDTFTNEEINKIFGVTSIFIRRCSESHHSYCSVIFRSNTYHYLNKIFDKIKHLIIIEGSYSLDNSSIYVKVFVPQINKNRYYELVDKGFFEIDENQFNSVRVGNKIDDKYTYLTLTEMEKSDAILA